MQFNISSETLLDEKYQNVSVDKILNKEVDLSKLGNRCVAANGCLYDKSKRGIFPELVEKIFTDRQIYKKKMLEAKQQYEKAPTKALEREISKCNNIQMARKIQINSLYGAIGTPYFRYYKLENAEAITLSGQVAIRWIESKLNTYMNKILKTQDIDFVIASDTDSIYLNMALLVNKVFLNKDKDLDKDKKVSYNERKKLSIVYTKQLLENKNMLHDLTYFTKHSKKDDLADCLLQGIYYLDNKQESIKL
jgi:DNA polymerase elongation subunit (family B)